MMSFWSLHLPSAQPSLEKLYARTSLLIVGPSHSAPMIDQVPLEQNASSGATVSVVTADAVSCDAAGAYFRRPAASGSTPGRRSYRLVPGRTISPKRCSGSPSARIRRPFQPPVNGSISWVVVAIVNSE